MPRIPDSNEWVIKLDKFYHGFGPAAHLNSLSELGNAGHASAMANVDVLDPTYITQGPGLSNLTNGTQAGAVSELINFILDRAVTDSVTYGIGPTKLFKITPTTVTSDGTWPQTITNATDGESVIEFQGALYAFFNKSSGGDISKFDLASTFDHDWGSTVPTGAAALQKNLHPSAKKEDILVFGNGRYLGVYISATNTIDVDRLDFGANTEVADVVFHANQWWIGVNTGITTGTNRASSQIYLYQGAAASAVLDDEVAVGVQKIGWIRAENGIVYVCYQDLSFSGGYRIGYIADRRIVPLASFTGDLPNYAQKTLYKNACLFPSSGLLYSAGAVIPDLPYHISQHADGGYATVGAVAAPFGTPMVASTDGGSNHRLAKFSGYDTACTWRSLVIPVMSGARTSDVDEVVVVSKHLGASARCDLILECNQDQSDSNTLQITTAGKRRHVFRQLKATKIEDFRVFLDWSNGSASNDCAIRQIIIKGHYVEN